MTRTSIDETTALAYEKWSFADQAVTTLSENRDKITDAEFAEVVAIRDRFWTDYQDHEAERRANRR